MARPVKYLETEEFVKVWESYDTLDEIEAVIAELCKKAGRQPMPREVIAAKAGNLRANGWNLSKKQVGPKNKYDEAYKNEFIAKLLAAKARGELVEVEGPPPAPAPPQPAVDPRPVIAELLKKLREGR